jgi:putative endonuclease
MFVYILKSIKTGRYYIGCSWNVQERLVRHNNGYVPATEKFRPYKLVFFQKFANESEARQVEARLKRLKRKDYVKKIIASGVIRFRYPINQ